MYEEDSCCKMDMRLWDRDCRSFVAVYFRHNVRATERAGVYEVREMSACLLNDPVILMRASELLLCNLVDWSGS